MKMAAFVKCIVLFFCLFAFQLSHAQQTFKTTSGNVIGYLEYLPQDYKNNSDKYPLVIFLHGVGERGANSTDPAVLKTTIDLLTKLGPPMHIKNGTQFPFILISPQLKNNYSSWPTSYVMEVIDHLKTYLRIDERRIHVTGLSMGGGGAWAMIQDYPKLFASAAPVCGAGNTLSKACGIAAENVAVWGFHGDADDIVSYTKTVNMVNAINACTPAPNPLAKTTIYKNWPHSVWSRAYVADNTYHTPNVYQWFMQYTKTKAGGNSIPLANAGSDKSTSSSSTTLTGSGTDSDGSIASYAWTQISGPSKATLSGATSSKLTASGLIKGKYEFRLKVTDNAGLSESDYVAVTVTSGNAAPVANAGADKVITLPTTSTSFTGSATDADGTIASYAWTKVSGGAATLSGASTSTLSVSGLVAGNYQFRLTVTDNGGATHSDDVLLTVNVAPTVSAGSDKVITLPVNTVSLDGTASDSDGTISSYSWTKSSGGTATLSGNTTAKLNVSNLVQGTYVFRLTVKDNRGATVYDEVKVTVNGGSNAAPVANAGSDRTIHLPTNSVSITGTGTDSDGSISSYSWSKVSGGGATLSGTSTATLSASALVAGTYVFRLTVKDNAGATATDDVSVIVNNPPTVSAGTDVQLSLPINTASLQGSASDSDGSISSYSWTKTSGGSATLTNATTSRLNVAGLTEGTYVFRLTVKDNRNASAWDEVTVNVAGASKTNTPPVANAGADQLIHLPTNSVTINGTGTDSDGSISTYKWTKVSGGTATLSGSSSNKLTASNLVSGTYTFRLTVTDNGGATHSDDVIVTVNTRPIVSAGADVQLSLPINTAALQGTASDPDGTIKSYSWSKVSGETATMAGATSSKLNLSDLVVGEYIFRLTVKDNQGASSSDDVIVRVAPGTASSKPPGENIAPVVYAGADYKLTLPTNSTVIQGTATDSDGTIVEYSWKMTTGTIATLSGVNTNRLTASGLVAGSYVFRLFATDDSGAKTFDDIKIIVLPDPNNNPPMANAGSDLKVLLPETSVTIQGSGTDSNDGIAAWQWTQLSGASTSLSNAQSSAVTVSGLTSGNYVFRLTVTDASGATAYDDVTVKVNNPPVVNVGENLTVWLPNNSVTIQGYATDSDGTIASYNWRMTTGTIATLSGVETSKLTASGLVEGSYVFRLYVRDNFGTQGFDDVKIFVKKSTSASSTDEVEIVAPENVVVNDLDTGDNDYWNDKKVTLYDGSGREVYNGRWSRNDYQTVIQPGTLYIYNVMSQGKILSRGKFVRVN